MKSIWCSLGFHSLDKVGTIEPIKSSSQFSSHAYLGHFAVGKCDRCGILKLQQCLGSWQYYLGDMVTREEYMEKFNEGEFDLGQIKRSN